jgi:hypothetical protein
LDYIRQHLSMPDVLRLLNYWNRHPPVHVLLAAWLVPRPELDLPPPTAEPDSLTPFVGAPEKPPAHIRELVDWAEQKKRSGDRVIEKRPTHCSSPDIEDS